MRKRVAEDKRSTATPVPEPKPAKRGFLGANGYELMLASVDDRIYDLLDRESREQADVEAKQAEPAHAAALTATPDSLVDASAALMEADEAARLMGISREALYQRVSRYQVPRSVYVRSGRRLQFRRERFLEWLKNGGGR